MNRRFGRKTRWFTLLLTACIVSSLFFVQSPEAKADKTVEPYIVVSLGDSYASGEGVEPFYCQDLPYEIKVKNEDWIAHRSAKSWSGQLTLPYLYHSLSAYKGQYWFFEANSGATTAEIVGGEALRKLPDDDNANIKNYVINDPNNTLVKKPWLTGVTYLPAQLEVFDQLEKGSVRYVTVSIGGNDAQFSKVMEKVMLGSAYLNLNSVEVMVQKYYDDDYKLLKKIMETVKDTYRAISKAAGPQATILVAGYPYLLEPDGWNVVVEWGESKCVNDAVFLFNSSLYAAVQECKAFDHLNIEFVSVADKFKDHEAYSDDPYINPLYLEPKSEDYDQSRLYSCYSFHPNEAGLEVYRECFQETIDKLEKDREQPFLLEESVYRFLNTLVSGIYHSSEFLVDRKTGVCDQDFITISALYQKLHEQDSERYPLERIGYLADYTLWSRHRASAEKEGYRYDEAWVFDLGAVQDVFDALYGKGRVTPQQFFGSDCFITSDGYILFPPYGTDSFLSGYDRYKIRDIKVDGNDITVTVNSICVTYSYKYDEQIAWDVPDYGSYLIYNLAGEEKRIESGRDQSLKEESDYERFADEVILRSTNYFDRNGFGTETFHLFMDEDGIHLR